VFFLNFLFYFAVIIHQNHCIMKKTFFKLIIAALFGSILFSCNKGIPVESIKLDTEDIYTYAGGTAKITATILPYSATERTITWKSSNNSVATVSGENYIEGKVTGKATGTATITATTKDGKFTASCTVEVVNPEPEMITVTGGTFTMGVSEPNSGAFPEHQVTVKNFKMGKYIVTEKIWVALMGGNVKVESKDFPMMEISWHDVQAFIKKLNELTEKKYRLPTEAEWEYAAYGGNKSQKFLYSGSNNIDDVAWYSGNSYNSPHSVGLKKANELGFFDMSGNIWEWCNDWWGLYSDEPQINPIGPSTGDYRIIRGGSFANPASVCRIITRGGIYPNSTSVVGFRLAHD